VNAKERAKIYEDALVNIMFHHGKCWDGKRECHDPQAVARDALKKADSKLFEKMDNLSHRQIEVQRDGSVVILKMDPGPEKPCWKCHGWRTFFDGHGQCITCPHCENDP